MDPVTIAKTAQILTTLAKSRTLRTIAAASVAVGAIATAVALTAPTSAVLSLLQATTGEHQQARQLSRTNTSCPIADDAGVGQLDAEQVRNGRIIWDVAIGRDLPDRAAVIAIATALQESSLRNLSHGDRDSIGLFQQRPSQGWGTAAQLADPQFATGKFLDALVKVPDWEHLPLTEAAQAVQRSAYPDAYGRWETTAAGLVAHYTSGSHDLAAANRQALAGMCAPGADTANCPATGYGIEAGLTPDAIRVLRCLHRQFPDIRDWAGIGDRPANVDDDHQTGRAIDAMIPDPTSPAGQALGDTIADWVVAHRDTLGVHYVIWNEQIWSTSHADRGWRPCSSGACYSGPNDTLAHRDHVHISVHGNSAGQTSGDAAVVTPVETFTITATFGQCASRWANCHTGLDFAAPTGTPVRAVADGTVSFAGWGNRLGNLTKITHSDGTESWYAHQVDHTVTNGSHVRAGQTIGHVGSTGNSTGPHLHLEIRVGGQPVDPARWLSSQGVPL